jgi:hypothetical protein
MHEIVIDRPASEASALLAIHNPSVLEAHGWSAGFWTCSDEDPVERALGALGRKFGDDWELKRLAGAKATTRKKTEDCEAMARQGDWVYIVGSHFGPKTGPLKPRRNFVARFNEARIKGSLDDATIPVEIARGTFKLHRLLNDALKASGLELIEAGAEEARSCIDATRKKGRKKRKKWAGRVEKGDWPVNIEGVAFRESGTLLLGLRYPVTRDGHPIVAEVDDIGKLFRNPPLDPAILRLWVLSNIGTAREPRGVRGLEDHGPELHVITGSLDSSPEESVLLHDHPEGDRAASQHHRFALPEVPRWAGVQAELVDPLDAGQKVEGLSIDGDGRFCYVIDDEKIRLRQA